MIITPQVPEFNYVTGNVTSARPATNHGTSITPGNNTYGSYTEIVSAANITKNCYRVVININSIASSTNATDSLCTIGIDTAGGTSWVDLISHLLCAGAQTYVVAGGSGGGHWYDFPLFIPAGSSIAAKGSINNATVGTQYIAMWLWGAPTDPSALKVGQKVETIGATPASSTGTSFTEGTTSDGAWTSLGTTTKPCFHWNLGFGVNNGATAAVSHSLGLSYGNGTSQKIIIRDKPSNTGSTETVGTQPFVNYCSVPVGATMYGRGQSSGTAQSGLSLAAYG